MLSGNWPLCNKYQQHSSLNLVWQQLKLRNIFIFGMAYFFAGDLFTLTSNKFRMVCKVDGNPQLDSGAWSLYVDILKERHVVSIVFWSDIGLPALRWEEGEPHLPTYISKVFFQKLSKNVYFILTQTNHM